MRNYTVTLECRSKEVSRQLMFLDDILCITQKHTKHTNRTTDPIPN